MKAYIIDRFFDVNVSDQSSNSADESVQKLDWQGRRRSRGSSRTVTSVPYHCQVTNTVPTSANQIEEEDPNHTTPPDFAPIHEPSP